VRRGRPVHGWLRVASEQLRTKRQLDTWVKVGVRGSRGIGRGGCG